jgi:hypothetical protein
MKYSQILTLLLFSSISVHGAKFAHLPFSIIFINSITDYLPVNVQLIDPPSVFVFIQLCPGTSLWVSTALLDYEQLTSTHSLDHHQDHDVPV